VVAEKNASSWVLALLVSGFLGGRRGLTWDRPGGCVRLPSQIICHRGMTHPSMEMDFPMNATSPAPLNGNDQFFPRLHCTSRIVIPARLSSTRLPEKLLLRETGKTLLQHTYEAALQAHHPSGITIAVDSQKLQATVEEFGGEAMMTASDLPSGTDRVAQVARDMPEVDIFVNLQGDEPDIDGESIDRVIRLLAEDPTANIATLASPIRDREKLENPACVKVVMDADGRALYFSRSPIPHARNWEECLLNTEPPMFYQHIGLYAYRREFLLALPDLPPSPLEEVEKLEQLRFLQAGHRILVGLSEEAPKGIDTPADYRAFVGRRCRQLVKIAAET
jgi:3-deoxy-manno-octulosonate cytidylyltransferase (CMP-KDO synthetase)